MTTRRAPPLLAIFGAVLLRLGGSDRLLFYVRPSTRPYVVAAGAVLLLVGLAGWLGAPSRRCSRTPWAGWLILVPVLAVAAVVPPPQGVLVGSPRDGPPSRSDDATEALRGTDPVTLKLSEFVVRATWAPATLRGRVLRVLGFVAGRRSGAFTLARLSITCCAADAQRDDIEARLGDGVRAPPAGTWVQVTGRFTGMSRRNRFVPVLAITDVATAPAPRNPYD